MARELLNYTITVDASQAKADLRELDRELGKVGTTATQAGTQIDQATKKAAPAFTELHQRTLQYSQGLKSSEEQVTKLAGTTTRETGRMDAALANVGRRLVAVFAVERIATFATQVVNTAGHIQDLSDKTGLSTTAIQKFGYAANLSGSSIDAVANAISVMSRNLVGGSSGAVEALNKLGLSQQALMRMEPEQAFLAITEAIRGMKNPMEQADVTMKIFGKGGKEILPAIKAGFAEAGDEAQRLGAIMSGTTVKALDDLGDTWTKVWAVMSGWTARVINGLVETVGLLGRIGSAVMPEWLKSLAGGATNFGAAGIFGRGLGLLETATADVRGALSATASGASPNALGGRGDLYSPAAVEELLTITDRLADSTETLNQRNAVATNGRKSLKQATDDLTASTLKYLIAQSQVNIGLKETVTYAERAASFRGLLASDPMYLRTGIAGAQQIDPATGLLIPSTNPYNMVGLQGAVTGTPGLTAGAMTPGAAGGGFWNSRGGQAAGVGIGMAGSAAMGAMTGGDPYASMIGSGAAAISGVMLAGTITSTVALGAATMGIGAAAVGVYMLVKHFASVSKEVKQARIEVDEFQQGLWKTMTAQQVTEAAGEKWAATLIVVRDAYERMGFTAAQAESDVAKLFDTRNPDQAREAMARINSVMSDYRAILGGVNEHMGELLAQASDLGIKLPQALLDSLEAAVKLGDMTEENARLIAKLVAAPEVDWAKVEEAAKRYGITIDSMGQQFQQHQISKTAQQMVDDMDTLLKGGVEMGSILFGMREEISKLVQDSLKFGTELPENMKPWIEELIKAGLLVDAQGNALKDITQLKFGESMQTTFQRVADSIQKLIDLLKGPLTGALDTVGGKVVRPRVEIDWQDNEGRTEPVGFANGGVVYAANGWMPRGTDTVPAMLTPGEGVLSRRGMAMLGKLNSGRSDGGGVTVHVDLSGATLLEDSSTTARKITEIVSREIVREITRERKFGVIA